MGEDGDQQKRSMVDKKMLKIEMSSGSVEGEGAGVKGS